MSLASGIRLGPYEILTPLGAGGMGEVYRARDTRLDRLVAVKVLPRDLAANDEARARFDREARAIAALNHPNICTLHDVGIAPAEEGHAPVAYLVMELLEGETLQVRLQRGPLAIDAFVEIAAALTDALDAAHARGLIHRDLKPANIFITSRGTPKILDFGLAKVAETDADVTRQRADVTGLGTTVGTVAYMSPEQLRAEPLDARTDLFSLGLVLYEMATGQRAFTGTTTAVISAAILGEQPAPPTSVRADLPPALEQTILKALEKDRTLRSQSAAELRADLLRIKRQGSSGSRAAVATTVKMPAAPASPAPAPAPAPRPAKTGAVALAAAVVVAAGAIAWWISQRPSSPDAPPPVAPQTRVEPAPVATPPPSASPPASPPPPTAAAAKSAAAAAPEPPPPPPVSPVPEPPASTAVGGRANSTARGLPPARGPRGRAGRGLMPAFMELSATLRDLPPEVCEIVSLAGDVQAREAAQQLLGALTKGGWKCRLGGQVPAARSELTVWSSRATPGVDALVAWGHKLNFPTELHVVPKAPAVRILIRSPR